MSLFYHDAVTLRHITIDITPDAGADDAAATYANARALLRLRRAAALI